MWWRWRRWRQWHRRRRRQQQYSIKQLYREFDFHDAVYRFKLCMSQTPIADAAAAADVCVRVFVRSFFE